MNEVKFIPGYHPSFMEQFNKLTEAYISNKVNPFESCGCFVGNLLNRHTKWHYVKPSCTVMTFGMATRSPNADELEIGNKVLREQSNGLYTGREIEQLEKSFMRGLGDYGGVMSWKQPSATAEQLLFRNFSTTLDLLRQVHISKGEIIEERPVFNKRQLQLTT